MSKRAREKRMTLPPPENMGGVSNTGHTKEWRRHIDHQRKMKAETRRRKQGQKAL